ncbi:MAG: Asp-tRNA(Asn)/Glu-tRNA(Gln) amidotransferase subunit GatA [candidate division KSB1 bacterium]|nr:Asp-tRNA(Asn)/Glu-tRNA(Gln) amidotransferase subunit GatA [candidate division KSB1 bacterium]MDZ7303129.1 Asp-tRNA(Asn)/Glu-tRNA(Gln) amidotransferase subunit GatA [candidate division KSB1 bacterium]MDZ7310110.1 Asp-tRNA(Asn)/Glu-tRNA(Gln) amidotransferase subunit GatA [candidate division KSB1 bacterium]
MDSNTETIPHIQEKLRRREITCAALVNDYLARIDNAKPLNAFLAVFPDRARARAQEIDAKLRAGKAGKLAGVVIAVKDILALKGERLTCGSRILENFTSPYDATVIQKLEQEDAIIIGKTNMDEFAMGSSNENSAFGPVKNPVNEEYVPGGSSGGSAVAVAANLAMVSLGTDTGGSIRQPAAFCGVVGMKPTYGRVSRFGLVAFASSLDQIGAFAHSVEDVARILEVICGHDERDSTSAPVPVEAFSQFLDGEVRGKVIGLPKEYLSEGVQKEIREAVASATDRLQQAGAVVKEISLPHTKYAIATYYIICTAEASSNLARYDGARYGRRAQNVESLEEMYVKSRSEGFGPEVKRRIMLGTYVLSAGYYEAYYRRALKVRTLIRRDFEQAFKECDVLLTPTSPTTAFKLGEKIDDPLTMYLSDIFTVSVNLAGAPGISIPAGIDANGLPIGLQIIGKAFDEKNVLQVAHFLETSRRQLNKAG